MLLSIFLCFIRLIKKSGGGMERSMNWKSGLGAWLIFIVCAIAGSTVAQETPFINNFIGSWNGEGELLGAKAKFKMTWEWVLERQFTRLTFQNALVQDQGETVVLKAQAFYRHHGNERFQGTWFDSRGMVLPLEANVEDSALVTRWGSPETEQGKTIYRLRSDGHIEVNDFVLKNNDWKSFGHAVYRRD
jgi:hypothetical protein